MDLKEELFNEMKKRGLLEQVDDENEEESKGKTSDFAELASILLHSQTQSHILHLQTESYAEHIALQGYYEGIDPLIDGLVESYRGKYGIVDTYKSMDFEKWSSTESTVKYMKDLNEKVDGLRDCCKDSYLQNQIDTICELINSTLYKLRFLK